MADSIPDVQFKPAGLSDCGAITQFVEEYYAYDGIAFDRDHVSLALHALVMDRRLGRVYVIRASGENCGYLILMFCHSIEFGGRVAFIDELYVRETHRGKGIGTLALAFVEEECRADAVTSVRLEVTHKNAAARELYRRSGFVLEDRNIMTKRLT
jgi:diamine N-acetyltransferase